MIKYSIRSPDSFLSMPWKNGLGTTIELLKAPLHANTDFLWRLSMADVNADGEFSNFAGYDRTLVLLEGNGITLEHHNAQQNVLRSPLQSASFSGDDLTIARLHDGPIKDFNVMSQRNQCSVEVITGKPVNNANGSCAISAKADLLLLYAVDDDVSIQLPGARLLSLSHQHLFISATAVDCIVQCSGGSYISILVTDF